MAVKIVPIRPLKRDLRKYVQFGIDLYAGNKYFVPPVYFDEINTFLPEKNPAYELSLIHISEPTRPY